MKYLLTNDFLKQLYDKAENWIISEFTVLIILTIVVIITLRMVRFAISRLKKTFLKRAEKDENVDTDEATKKINTLFGILHGVIKVVLISVYLLIVLQKFGVNIAPILASAGIIGLAVGFGAQELVRDVISGFFILLEDQIRIGDVAVINGTSGLVEKIELRTITLRDFNGIVHIFQNGKIDTLSNRTKEWSAMVFDIGVAYKEDIQTVMEIMKTVGDELLIDPYLKDKIIEPIEIFGLDEFADSALIIKARIKTKPSHQWAVGREYRKRLKSAFDTQNIEIPFPHTTLYWGEKISPLKLDVNDTVLKNQK